MIEESDEFCEVEKWLIVKLILLTPQRITIPSVQIHGATRIWLRSGVTPSSQMTEVIVRGSPFTAIVIRHLWRTLFSWDS